jgi:acetyl esterase/lipase
MRYQILRALIVVFAAALVVPPSTCVAQELIDVWPDLAPGETTRSVGEKLPARPEEVPPVTRVTGITRPTMTWHPAAEPNGMAAIILPGGGFGRVVPDKEGTEAAAWLNQQGISAFVLSYRTTNMPKADAWKKPLQDIQRALSVVRSQSERWGAHTKQLGIVAFSAGGQVGARLLCDGGKRAYEPIDATDDLTHRPAFAVLVYPWNLYDDQSKSLIADLKIPSDCPPTFLIHTHDDRSSSLGTVLFYAGLKQHNIPAELHVYGNGGHGYGLRPVKGSDVATWPTHAAHWLNTQKHPDAPQR